MARAIVADAAERAATLEAAADELERGNADEPINTDNCAQLVGLTPRVFSDAGRRGYFPAWKAGNKLTSRRADVVAWLETRRIVPRVHTIIIESAKGFELSEEMIDLATRVARVRGRSFVEEKAELMKGMEESARSRATREGRREPTHDDWVAAGSYRATVLKMWLKPTRSAEQNAETARKRKATIAANRAKLGSSK